jgi:hypothetical protein
MTAGIALFAPGAIFNALAFLLTNWRVALI